MRKSVFVAAALAALASSARAEELEAQVQAAAPRVDKPYYTYASFAFNAYTHLDATAKAGVANLTPANRAIVYQQVGFGYFVHPNLRLQLTMQFGETLTNVPAGASAFTTLGFIPWIVFTTHGFFTGAGPLLCAISYGKVPQFDAGLFTATGYSFALGHGVALAPALQVVAMVQQRTSIALTPTVALGWRF